MKRISVLLAASAVSFLLCQPQSLAQNEKGNTYNLQRAYEVLQNDNDLDKAVSLLNDQLSSTPDNAEAYLLRARIFMYREDYGSALNDIGSALKVNRPKKSGIMMSTLYWWEASIYNEMEDFKRAAEFYKMAVSFAKKDDRDNLQSISFDYGQCLYQLGCYAEADNVYREMVRRNDADQAARLGLARNMIERGEYADAVECIMKTIPYDKEYAESYKFLASAYDKMDETDKAIDNILVFFDKDEDLDTDICMPLLVKHPSYAEARIRECRKDSDEKGKWDLLMIGLYEKTGKPEIAIGLYDKLEEEYGQDPMIFYKRAQLYEGLGLSDRAIEQYTRAMEKDSDYLLNCTSSIGDVYRSEAQYELARQMYEKVIDEIPSNAYGYYAAGWCWELEGNDEKALEYYDRGIDLDKDYPYIFLMRGELHHKYGRTEQAKADFETVLQLDTAVSNTSCRMYALYFLGMEEEAFEWMDRIIGNDPYDPGNYYDKACLMARMGREEEAVAALSEAFSRGFSHIGHVEHDDDMDSISDRDDYKTLIATYREKISERIEALEIKEEQPSEPVVSEIDIRRMAGGTFEVPCSVNGLDLKMLFDTGASDVTISSVEANFMLKNGHLGKDDIKGKKYYQIANGDITEGTVVLLREVKVGDAILRNVEASVVKSQKAPLLLGQSVMERFGTITIDNINSKLIISQ